MEENGCADASEAERRLMAWGNLGAKALLDLATFHKVAGIKLPHMTTPSNWRKACPAWKRQIHVLLAAQGLPCDDQHIVECLANWGAENGDTCLINLKPLPCPKWRSWLWPQWCNVEESKQDFLQRIQTGRCHRITEMIRMSPAPRCVVFYSTNTQFRSCWQQISGCNFDMVVESGIFGKRVADTVFVAIPQRRKQGIPYALMTKIGNWIRTELANLIPTTRQR